MGSFYTNITLRTTDRQRVADLLRSGRRQAYVSPPSNGCTVVFDRECDDQDTKVLNRLASSLSKQLGCPALAVLIHDDDVLFYTLHDGGRLVDEYNSTPAFDTGRFELPSGGDSAQLCRAFGADEKVNDVEAVLRVPSGGDDGFTFESERHERLVAALGLPTAAVATGYGYLEAGEFPDDTSESDFLRVS